MLFKRIINIALIFTILISVIGISTTNSYCIANKKMMVNDNCCKKNAGKECCMDITTHLSLKTDLSVHNASVPVPDILFFALPYIQAFLLTKDALETHHSFTTYNPPLITQDIPIRNQVFRI